MAEFDMFDMFTNFGFDEDTKTEETKETKVEEVPATETTTTTPATATTEGSAIVEDNPFDNIKIPNDDADEDEDDSSDEVTEEESSKPAAETKTAKKPVSRTKTGDTAVKLPVTVYGRNFVKTIEALEKADYNNLVKELYEAGYKEVATASIVPFDGGVFVEPDTSKTEGDTQVSFPENGAVYVVDGLLQTEITAAVIGKDADEISVDDLRRGIRGWRRRRGKRPRGYRGY